MDIYRKIFHNAFKASKAGRLVLCLPDGNKLYYGQGQADDEASIRVRDTRFFKRCVLNGDIGLGEAYMDGDWESDDVTKVIEWFIANRANDGRKKIPLFHYVNKIRQMRQSHGIHRNRENIEAHYDISNEFYRMLLDETMTYSCAYFTDECQSLGMAQKQKYQILCEKLMIEPNDHILDIGCGWGGFAVYTANKYRCRITAITISRKQYEHTSALIYKEGLADRINVQYLDYREIKGTFDKIVAIEMLQGVGHKYHDAFFAQSQRLLKKEGLLGMQMIIVPDHAYAAYCNGVDWVQKHMFPGLELPSFEKVFRAIRRTGTLQLFDYEDITSSFDRTITIWNGNLNTHREQILSLGFNESFIRKWNYHLCLCKAAVRKRATSVIQVVFGQTGVPETYRYVKNDVVPVAVKSDGPLQRNQSVIQEFYRRLNKDTLDLIDEIYEEHAFFKDPMVEYTSRRQIKRHYQILFDNISSIEFQFPSEIIQANTHMIAWKMTVKQKTATKSSTLEGISHIRFGENGRIIYHRDYFDMGEFVYEKIPIISAIIRNIKKRFST